MTIVNSYGCKDVRVDALIRIANLHVVSVALQFDADLLEEAREGLLGVFLVHGF